MGKEKSMKVTVEYIHHSGYVVETEKVILIFDYVMGQLPSHYLQSEKQVCFLVSHGHDDHFSSSIFAYFKTIVLSDDIENIQTENNKFNIYQVAAGDMLVCDGISIKVFGSTDIGVSYLVSDGEANVFFAGDLNDWHWKTESTEDEIELAHIQFLNIVRQIKDFPIDIAMFPVDERLKVDIDQGARLFIEHIKPQHFFPMHFKNKESLIPLMDYIKDFAQITGYIPERNNTRFTCNIE